MEVILSSEVFNPNETLWAEASALQGRSFQEAVVELGEKSFESKPLSARHSETGVDSEDAIQYETVPETHVEAEEIFLDEPVEKTVTLTEVELENKLAEVKRDAETRITEQLGIASKDELGRLGKQQEEFFNALLENLNHGDALVSEFVSLALKVGALLARTQLTLDEEVISSFVKSAVKGVDTTDADIFSIKLSGSWKIYRESINTQLTDNISFFFDDSLKPGDVILTAGQGGYFDLLEERISDIQGQLDSMDYSSLEKTAIDFFRKSAEKSADDVVEEVSQPNNEEPHEASLQGDGEGKVENKDSSTEQEISNRDLSPDDAKVEDHSGEHELESTVGGGQENSDD
jgi:hypothetical protein